MRDRSVMLRSSLRSPSMVLGCPILAPVDIVSRVDRTSFVNASIRSHPAMPCPASSTLVISGGRAMSTRNPTFDEAFHNSTARAWRGLDDDGGDIGLVCGGATNPLSNVRRRRQGWAWKTQVYRVLQNINPICLIPQW